MTLYICFGAKILSWGFVSFSTSVSGYVIFSNCGVRQLIKHQRTRKVMTTNLNMDLLVFPPAL